MFVLLEIRNVSDNRISQLIFSDFTFRISKKFSGFVMTLRLDYYIRPLTKSTNQTTHEINHYVNEQNASIIANRC